MPPRTWRPLAAGRRPSEKRPRAGGCRPPGAIRERVAGGRPTSPAGEDTENGRPGVATGDRREGCYRAIDRLPPERPPRAGSSDELSYDSRRRGRPTSGRTSSVEEAAASGPPAIGSISYAGEGVVSDQPRASGPRPSYRVGRMPGAGRQSAVGRRPLLASGRTSHARYCRTMPDREIARGPPSSCQTTPAKEAAVGGPPPSGRTLPAGEGDASDQTPA